MNEFAIEPPSAGGRRADGRKKSVYHPNKQTGTLWRRVKDNWSFIEKIAKNEDLGSEIGRLYLAKVINDKQASAARIYAEVVGRYEKFFGGQRRDIMSPAYQRGSRGKDDEIEKLLKSGRLSEYEDRAKKAKKAWLKVEKAIPNETARSVMDEVCIYDRHLYEVHHDDFKRILDRIGLLFFGKVAASS